MRKLDPPRRRLGLNEAQRRQLGELEGKQRLTAYEQGQCAAYRLFGADEEADRAEKVLNHGDLAKVLQDVADEHRRPSRRGSGGRTGP